MIMNVKAKPDQASAGLLREGDVLITMMNYKLKMLVE